MPAQRAEILRIAMDSPADMAGLHRAIAAGMNPARLVAILGKTEGNGGVNDFTREFACAAFAAALAPALGQTAEQVADNVAMVMSGGTEGVLSPHATLLLRHPPGGAAPRPGKRLVIGVARTRDFRPHELGRQVQMEETRAAVLEAMADAGLTDPADVHYVQVKCPLLTAGRVAASQAAGHAVVTENAYKSMGYSRGAAALGVALALGEIAAPVPDGAVCTDWSLYSGVASASAGIELMHDLVIVLGNAEGAESDLVIDHAVMADAMDAAAVRAALHGAEPVALFAKAEASPNGQIRGHRHTMLDDTDISATRHARAAVGGLIAGLAGHPALFISGGAEHQGPPGGGVVAVIRRV